MTAEATRTSETLIAELTAANTELQIKFSGLLEEKAALENKQRALLAALRDERHRVSQLRAGLAVYKPGPFWDTVVPDTKADADQGKHAEWVLRMTAGVDDPEGA